MLSTIICEEDNTKAKDVNACQCWVDMVSTIFKGCRPLSTQHGTLQKVFLDMVDGVASPDERMMQA